MRHNILLTLGLLLCTCLVATAQLKLPQPSPAAKATYTFGVTDVALEYSRPGLKGRSFGAGELDYNGKWYRTGANAATTISFSTDVMINGQKLAAGKYGLYSIPGKDEWTVIFSKNATVNNGDNYKQEEDALRVTAKTAEIPQLETFTIDLQNVKSNSADLEIKWDKVKVPVKIESAVDELALANIDKALGSTWSTYANAANYTLQSNANLDKGKDWINKSISLKEHFWNVYMLAQFQAKEGNYNEAIKTLERSNTLANANAKDPFNAFVLGENAKLMTEYKSKATADTKKKK